LSKHRAGTNCRKRWPFRCRSSEHESAVAWICGLGLVARMDGISPDPLPPGKPYRVNRNIRAQEVCVIGQQGQQLGIMPIADALNMTRAAGIDLVEIERKGKLPVCRLVDFGMLRYELAKKRKK